MLGKYKLCDLNNATYKRVFINPLLKKYQPATVILVHKIFNITVDDEILPRNQFTKS